MRKETRITLVAAMAALFTSTAPAAPADLDTAANRAKVERFAAELAAELNARCPKAAPADQAAFERCRQALFDDSFLRRGLSPVTLWGRMKNGDHQIAIKDSTLTQFNPDVLAGMYLPLFMFNGKYTVSYEPREKMYLVGMEAGFRNRLQVTLDWLWAYLTFERGSRLITGDDQALGARTTHLAGACACEML